MKGGQKSVAHLHLTVRSNPSAALRTKGLVDEPVKPFMVRQGSLERSRGAYHEWLNLKLPRLKLKINIGLSSQTKPPDLFIHIQYV